MKNQFLTLLFFALCSSLFGQLINDGGTITVEPGAKLIVEGDITNLTGSSILNNGTIELQGNYSNDAIDDQTNGVLIFSGVSTKDFTPGTGIYHDIQMNKVDGDVNLLGDLEVLGELDFNGENTKLILGDHNANIETGGSIIGYDENEYVVTEGLGYLEISSDVVGQKTFPVGDANNYSPLNTNTSGSTVGANGSISVKVNNMLHPEKPAEAADYLTRYWDIIATDIADYTNAVEGTFVPADDVVGNVSSITGAAYNDVALWDYYDGGDGISLVSGTLNETDVDFTGMKSSSMIDVTVLLEGPYTGNGMMTTTLNSMGLLPGETPISGTNFTVVGQPYDGLPWNHTGSEGDSYGDVAGQTIMYPENITDWVLVTARKGVLVSGPGEVYEDVWKCAGLLEEDGDIVFPKACPYFNIEENEQYHLVVEHRNHLPVMSTVLTPALNALSFDFTSTDSWKSNAVISDQNVGQKLNGTYYMMFSSNSEQISGRTDINSADNSTWLNESNQTVEYLRADFDMNADVNATDRTVSLPNISLFNLIPFD